MDPTVVLEEIRKLIKQYNEVTAPEFNAAHWAYKLVGLIEGLDEWMSKGGFLPEQWVKARS